MDGYPIVPTPSASAHWQTQMAAGSPACALQRPHAQSRADGSQPHARTHLRPGSLITPADRCPLTADPPCCSVHPLRPRSSAMSSGREQCQQLPGAARAPRLCGVHTALYRARTPTSLPSTTHTRRAWRAGPRTDPSRASEIHRIQCTVLYILCSVASSFCSIPIDTPPPKCPPASSPTPRGPRARTRPPEPSQ